MHVYVKENCVYGFIQRLEDSSNVIIQTLTSSWPLCFVDGSAGFQNCINKCFLLPFTYEVWLVVSLRLQSQKVFVDLFSLINTPGEKKNVLQK